MITMAMVKQAAPWESQSVYVDGVPHLLGEIFGGRWFHGTSATLKPGDVLEPGHGKHFDQSSDNQVSITSIEGRARMWANEYGGTHVYEVEPIGPITPWRMAPANYGKNIQAYEARVRSARIVKEV